MGDEGERKIEEVDQRLDKFKQRDKENNVIVIGPPNNNMTKVELAKYPNKNLETTI